MAAGQALLGRRWRCCGWLAAAAGAQSSALRLVHFVVVVNMCFSTCVALKVVALYLNIFIAGQDYDVCTRSCGFFRWVASTVFSRCRRHL